MDGFGWRKWKPSEHEAYIKAKASEAHIRREELHEMEEQEKQAKVTHRKKLGAERAKKYRTNKKMQEASTAEDRDSSVLDVNTALMRGADAMAASNDVAIPDAAKVSRAGKEEWRQSRNGTQGGAVQSDVVRMNYYHPYIWCHIDKKMRQCGWSAAATAKALEHDFPALFSKLHKGTIQRWKEKGENRWTEKTLLNVKNCSVLEGSGHTGILAPYPETVKEINTVLTSLRASAIPLNIAIGRSIIWAIIHERHPELLKNFKISEHWVRLYYKSNLKWSP